MELSERDLEILEIIHRDPEYFYFLLLQALESHPVPQEEES